MIPRLALAGDGTIDVESLSSTGRVAKAGASFKVYLDAPRTPAELDDFEAQMRLASQSICDATDGKFYFRNIRYVTHPSEKKNADVWWYRRYDRSGSAVGWFGRPPAGQNCLNTGPRDNGYSGSFAVYSALNQAGDRIAPDGHLIAHEMHHLIFGVLDEYPNDPGDDGFDLAGTGIHGVYSWDEPYTGKPFFRNLYNSQSAIAPAGYLTGQPRDCDGFPLYLPGADGASWWRANLTLSQQASGQVCRTDSSRERRALSDFNQVLAPFFPAVSCQSNTDCLGQTGFRPIPGSPDTVDFLECGIAEGASELSTPGSFNRNRFNRTLGAVRAPGNTVPRIQAGNQLVLQGFLVPSSTDHPAAAAPPADIEPPCGLPSTGAGCAAGCAPVLDGAAAAEFQCTTDTTGATPCPLQAVAGSPDAGSGSPATCSGCLIADSSACLPVFGSDPTAPRYCGNAIVDADFSGPAPIGEQMRPRGSVAARDRSAYWPTPALR